MCCNTLAYSFVDNDRLFLRPTVRGRGVNGSIEEVSTRLVTCTHSTMRDLNIYDFKRALPRMVLFSFRTTTITHLPRRVGRARTCTTSGDVRSANLQKKPTLPAHKNRSSSSVGSRSVLFVLTMATLSTRKHLSVGTYPPPSPTCVHGADKRKITRRS